MAQGFFEILFSFQVNIVFIHDRTTYISGYELFLCLDVRRSQRLTGRILVKGVVRDCTCFLLAFDIGVLCTLIDTVLYREYV